jgi:membrane-bound serine protease (ClpP class)
VGSTSSTGHVIVAQVSEIVDLGMAPFLERMVQQAQDSGARALVLEINTLGGRVDAAILIRDVLVDAEIPTIAFIHPRAISAGALIALSCETIAMAPGGSIGAATPVQGSGGEMEAAEEKVVSYWRSEMRATAERRGRRGDLAEAMVDRDVSIEDVIEEGKLLTLTTSEALALGIADFESTTLDQVLEELDLGDATVTEAGMNWAERIARVVSHPVLSSFLLSLGFLGIVIELYRPGWGIPGSVGLACLFLFFLGHYVVRLAGIEEILLFGLGVVLLAVEILVIPGFGIAGIAGFALMMAGAFLALIGLDLSVSWDLGLIREALAVLSGAVLGVVGGSALAIRLLPKTALGRVLILQRGLTAESGYVSHSQPEGKGQEIGAVGRVTADLRPVGRVRLGKRRVDAISEGSFIPAGTEIVVLEWRGAQVVVRPRDLDLDDDEQPS